MKRKSKRLVLLGIPVDNLNMEDALNRIIEMTDMYKHNSRNHLVATANVDFIINAHKGRNRQISKELLYILRQADLVTADGMPLVWLSKLLGNPLEERVTGADMVPALAHKAAATGKSIYLLGGKDGSAKKTADILQAQNPGLKIAGFSAPLIDLDHVEENKKIIARINLTNPDILLIALGNPKQELWFHRYRQHLRVPVSIGVGGTFEFISGLTSRAPDWIQKSGLEWIYRMLQDPKRLIKRYAMGLLFFNLMILPLLALHKILSLFKSKPVERIENVLPFFLSIPQDLVVHWKDVCSARGLDLLLGQLTRVNRLTLNFKGITNMSLIDLNRLMDILLSAHRLKVVVDVCNLGWIPSLMLRVHRVFDLVRAARFSAQLQIGADGLKKIA